MRTEKEIARFLFDFNFPTRLNGYHYFKECLVYIFDGNILPMNKELFLTLADKFSTDEDNIERCMQTLVDKMWLPMQNVGIFSCKPSIREFIMKCVEYIKYDSTRQRSAYDILFRRG